MATIVTFGILAASAGVLWWLLPDAFGLRRRGGGPKCPVCGGRRTEAFRGERRCTSCGARFKAHGAWRLHEPTLPELSVVLLASLALLLFAVFDLLLAWRIFGAARAGLIVLAAGAGAAAAVSRFVRHRRQYGRN